MPTLPKQKSAPAKPVSPSRQAAFLILEAIQANQGNCDTLLHGPLTEQLTPLDHNLATTLVMGVLRWQIALDAIIVPLLSRPGVALPSPIATALRLGAFQLLHLDRIPAHAAISESVELCRLARHDHASGMVNAILRKLAARPLQPTPKSLRLRLALATAHPLWLIDRWLKQYGEAATTAICHAGQQQPTLALRYTADVIPEGWHPGALLTCTIRREEATATLPENTFAMDEGSQLIAEIAALEWPATQAEASTSPRHFDEVKPTVSPACILDTCAAPGGKTLILAQRSPHASILACDASPSRLKALRQRLASLPNVHCLQADAADLPTNLTNFHRILCDLPCSGTGTLARNPEIRHRLQPADLNRQADRQRNILRTALGRLAIGGRLIYSTCSLEPEENEEVISAVLATEKNTEKNFQQLDIRPSLDALLHQNILQPSAHKLLTETAIHNGQLRTLPGTHPTDGFFIAILQRTQ